MSDTNVAVAETNRRKLSLDTWAVLIALGAAVLVRFGLFPSVPW